VQTQTVTGISHQQLGVSRGVVCRLTLVLLTSFQTMMGTMKMGMPMYEAMKLLADQFPFRKTEKPVTSVMMDEPAKPNHAA
jgi:type II secretory pathway component PulF